ncbi:unnamed protein product [Ranitomeya imitator]|uniref:Uncharacterized protein n=1 Tax=Ranitomeya imitator TaxID=111125 RepID=A0ABN9LR86_9NEOB|nr:unnamed protein product [Ranitomeya imitator]
MSNQRHRNSSVPLKRGVFAQYSCGHIGQLQCSKKKVSDHPPVPSRRAHRNHITVMYVPPTSESPTPPRSEEKNGQSGDRGRLETVWSAIITTSRGFHQGWRRPFYGNTIEKEEYRREIRQLLKKQMSDKWSTTRETLLSQSKELEALKEADRSAILQDLEQERAKALFLRRYRDENKRLMEKKWQENRLTRSMETLKERELLQYNPINWSGTLK